MLFLVIELMLRDAAELVLGCGICPTADVWLEAG